MKTAIVILNYNGADLLRRYLPSVLTHTPEDMDIFVIDNASSDNSIQVIQSLSNQIRINQLQSNLGFAGGYNEGLKQVCADYYILLNSDVEVTKDWAKPLIHTLEHHSHIGAVAPKILSVNHPTYFEYAGASGGFLDRHGYAFCRGRIFDTVEQDDHQYDAPIAIAWASGCCLAIRANLFHGLGGFDDRFFAHYEEIDLCWRLRRAGFQIHCIPQSVIYHLGGGTIDYTSPRKLYLNFRNSLATIYKNYNGITKWIKIIIRLILDGVAALQFLLKGQFSSIGSILKAHWSFYSMLSYLREKKQEEEQQIEAMHIGPAVMDGQLNKSILWAYFIKKQKTFKSIIST